MNKLNCSNVDTRSFISNNTYKRHIPSKNMEISYFTRPSNNKYAHMPILDLRANNKVAPKIYEEYKHNATFHPGSSAPYNTYSKSVDTESKLFNRFKTLQNCPQNEYVPSSKSDLYNKNDYSNNLNSEFTSLNRNEQFLPFNPNGCNLGNNLFNNHTRQQLKNL